MQFHATLMIWGMSKVLGGCWKPGLWHVGRALKEKDTWRSCVLYKQYVIPSVHVLVVKIHSAQGPACRQMVFIFPETPTYSSERSLSGGKKKDWCWRKMGKCSMAGSHHKCCGISPLQLVPSSPTSKPSAQKQKVPFLVMTQP